MNWNGKIYLVIFVASVVGLLVGKLGLWNILEPMVGIATLAVAGYAWFQLQVAKKKKYANQGGDDFVIALQVGRPIAEAVKAHFGELDALIEVQAVLGKPVLETNEDYRRLASEVYKAMAQNQNCKIKLVLSGPVGLSFLIGQLVGLHHFDVEVFQYDPTSKGYQALPVPGRDWL